MVAQSPLQAVTEALLSNVDEKTLASSPRFFKESIRYHGVSVPKVNAISKSLFKTLDGYSKTEVFELCEQLWKTGYLEESFVACHWSYAARKHYLLSDYAVFERWILNYVTNWASCDTLCNHSVGTLVEMYPECLTDLIRLTTYANRWARRAAAVSLIIPAKKGLFVKEVFEIADALLTDPDDLVQKGYGWLLKAASEANQSLVFDYVCKNKARMPRTALRYAIEKMPAPLRKTAMEKQMALY